MQYDDWEGAVKATKIKRIDYKSVLGKSLTQYVLDNDTLPREVILRRVLLELRKPENKIYLNGLNFIDATKNIRVSLSARRSEQKTYLEVKA